MLTRLDPDSTRTQEKTHVKQTFLPSKKKDMIDK